MALEETAYAPYSDPEEFIREWTDRIWVQRGIGLIRDNYAPDSIVHGAYGTSVGVEPVIQGTLQKISAFPDRVGQAEDVVWEARGDDAFISSHLVLSKASHSRTSDYGPATANPFTSRAIATCLYREGVMEEEWVIRDEYAILRDLGFDPEPVARAKTVEEGLGLGAVPRDPLSEGVSGPRPDHYRTECEQVLGLVEEVWNGRRLDLVSRYIDRDVICRTTRHSEPTRPEGYQTALLDLLAPFPDCRVEVLDIAANHAERHGGLRIGVVWLLKGTYQGVPRYGRPTGTPVEILGASQFRFHQGRIVEETRIYDELAVLAQIVRGAPADAHGGDT